MADACLRNYVRWLWVPAPVRNCALGRDDALREIVPLLPAQRAAVLILDHPCLKKILLLLQVHRLRHPWKRILGFVEHPRQPEEVRPALVNMVAAARELRAS